MTQWNSIEDESGMSYVITAPHFAFEAGHAAIRTEEVDLSAAVIDGRLLKVILADNDAAEAIGFVAMREKTALSEGADLEYFDLLADRDESADLLIGEGALGDMTAGSFTYAANWTFGTQTFTRTAEAADHDIVHDDAATAGVLYKIVFTVATRTAGGLTAQVGATDGTKVELAGTYTQYLVAGDTTAFTLQADDTFAGTVTAMYCYVVDVTGYALAAADTALTAVEATGVLVYTYTAGSDDTGVKVTLDDVLNEDLTVGKLYKLTFAAGCGSTETATLDFCNTSDEVVQSLALVDAVTDISIYFHYEAGMYFVGASLVNAEDLSVDMDSWEVKEVERMGTDALVIMNSDGDKYCWDSKESGFDENSDDYTFDIYEMRGGVAGETRLGTMKATFMTEGLLQRATSRDSTMEYPDHKDMEDFDD